MSRGKLLTTLCAVGVIVAGGVARCLGDGDVQHVQLWMISQAAPRAVAPPWTLHWETSPIWFERWNAAGLSESPSRRIAVTDKHVLTVARRTLYFIDKATGRTGDSIELMGNEIFDWAVVGGHVVYASWDWNTRNPIHGAVELTGRKAAWVSREPGRIDLPEWIVPLDSETVLFGSDSDGPASGQFAAVDLRSGARRWTVAKTFGLSTVIPHAWFIYGRQLLGLLSSREGGGRMRQTDVSCHPSISSRLSRSETSSSRESLATMER